MTNSRIILGLTLFFILGLYLNIAAQVQNEEVFEFPATKQKMLLAYRFNINIPDIDGYKTLKCDFHIHTVFSDGQVWPTMRVIEAWNDGLDAIAITDHVGEKYQRYRDLLSIEPNKSAEIAIAKGAEIGLLVIKGAEITRQKPLGHINALFVNDVKSLDVDNELDAINAAVKQGAFLQWNHPGWPNDTSTLYSVHRELIKQKKLNGAEVFNGSEYYPKVLDWCNEYGLSFMANTDLHYASANSYREKLQRPMTLVFAKELSVEGIKEALFAGQTLAWFNNHLAGKEEYIRQLIKKSLSVKVIDAKKNIVEICNRSDLPFEMKFGKYSYGVPLPANETLRAEIPSGSEVTFTNCLIGKNRYATLKLW